MRHYEMGARAAYSHAPFSEEFWLLSRGEQEEFRQGHDDAQKRMILDRLAKEFDNGR